MLRPLTLALAVLLLACSSSKKGDFDSVRVTERVTGVTGLGGDVNVLHDGLAVPHIYAGSDADGAFALGYMQARGRMFQMDMFRKAARGRLGELLGALANRNQDIFLRTMFTSRLTAANGTHHVEDVIADQLDPALRAFAQRYADGVNRWLADVKAGRNGAVLHPQYRVFAATVDDIAPWTIEDSIAIGRLQSFQLSDTSDVEIAAGKLATANLPADVLADVTRHAQAVPSVILDVPGALRAGKPAGALVRRQAAPAWLAAARGSIDGALAFRGSFHLPLAGGDRAGSNNWSVAPAITANGHALVANDPHLSLSDPPNFHMVHLVTPTRNVAGVAFPGTPVVVIGHNDRIAWGATVVGYDVTDVYTETIDAAPSPTSVTLDGAPVPLTVITETRHVRGQADQTFPVFLVPHRGPLLPGSIVGTSALSVRWTGQDPTFEVKAIYDLGAARSVDEAFEAVKSFGVGAQNFNIGDTAGHIGYDPHAVVPIRPAGCVPWLPMPGGTGACDWTGVIPDAELPQAKDPAKHYIATANNDVTGALVPGPGQTDANPLAAPHYLYAYTDIGFREQRIQHQLESTGQHTLDGMTALQADVHSGLAETMMPGLLAALSGQSLSPDALAVVALWSTWDFSTPRGDEVGAPGITQNSAASAAFHAFQKRFVSKLFAPVTAAGLDFTQIPIEQTMKIGVGVFRTPYPLATSAATLCGGPCGAAAVAALEETVTFLRGRLSNAPPVSWRWGDLHHVLFSSLAAPLLPDFGPFPNDGGLFTVDVANFDLFDDRFEQHGGGNVRIATELDPKGVRSRMVIPGGQVDRPGIAGAQADPRYMDQVPAWLANDKGDQPYAQADVVRAATGRVVFTR